MMWRPRKRVLAVCCALSALLAASVARGTEDDPQPENVALGALSYRVHCVSCHGESGRGDGPLTETLKIRPADLTRPCKEHGGELSVERTSAAIDGREEIRAHGTREMPVWGIGLRDLGRDTDQEGEVRAKILDLIAFLKTLQNCDETRHGEKP